MRNSKCSDTREIEFEKFIRFDGWPKHFNWGSPIFFCFPLLVVLQTELDVYVCVLCMTTKRFSHLQIKPELAHSKANFINFLIFASSCHLHLMHGMAYRAIFQHLLLLSIIWAQWMAKRCPKHIVFWAIWFRFVVGYNWFRSNWIVTMPKKNDNEQWRVGETEDGVESETNKRKINWDEKGLKVNMLLST